MIPSNVAVRGDRSSHYGEAVEPEGSTVTSFTANPLGNPSGVPCYDAESKKIVREAKKPFIALMLAAGYFFAQASQHDFKEYQAIANIALKEAALKVPCRQCLYPFNSHQELRLPITDPGLIASGKITAAVSLTRPFLPRYLG